MSNSGPRDVIKLWEDMKATPYPDWMVNPSHSILKMHRVHPITAPYLKLAKAGKTREFIEACRDIFVHPVGSYERDMIGIAMYLGNWWLAKGRYKAEARRTKVRQIAAKRAEASVQPVQVVQPRVPGAEHGVNGYNNKGCRCEVCVTANKARLVAYRLRKKQGAAA